MQVFSSADFLIGTLFVGVFALTRFHEDKEIRLEAPALRFECVAVLYLLTTELLFVVVTFLIAGLRTAAGEEWSTVLSGAGLPVTEQNAQFSPQLLAALFLTVLLPKIPRLKSLDAKIIRSFQRTASLSSAAGKLSKVLQSCTLSLDEHERNSIKQGMIADGLKERDVRFEDDGSPQHQWTRAYAFCDKVLKWEQNEAFHPFVDRFYGQYQALAERFREFRDKAKHAFMLDRAAARDPTLGRAVEECKREYERQLHAFAQQTCDFASRAILYTYPTSEGRKLALKRLGIDGGNPPGLTVHEFARMFLLLLVTLVIAFIITGHLFGDPDSRGQRVLLSIMIATNYCVAILCAVVVKRLVDPACAADRRPWATYVLAGAAAAACASVISILYNGIAEGGLTPGLSGFLGGKFWWTVIPMVTAIATSYMTDNRVDERTQHRLRWQEGALQACCTALGAGFATYMMGMGGRAAIPIVISGVLGFLIGYLVPTWYRGTPTEAHRPHNAALRHSLA